MSIYYFFVSVSFFKSFRRAKVGGIRSFYFTLRQGDISRNIQRLDLVYSHATNVKKVSVVAHNRPARNG